MKFSFRYIDTQDLLIKAIERLKLSDDKVIGLDTETFYQSKLVKLSVLQLATYIKGNIESYVIDCLAVNINKAKEILEDEQYLKLMHNASYDVNRLKENAGLDIINIWCTQKAEHQTKQTVNLEDTVKRYLGEKLDKSYQTSRWEVRPLSDGQKKYAAKDAAILVELYPKQKEKHLDGTYKSKHLVGDSIFDTNYDEISQINNPTEHPIVKDNIIVFDYAASFSHIKIISNVELYDWLEDFVNSGKALNFRPFYFNIDASKLHIKSFSDSLLNSISANRLKLQTTKQYIEVYSDGTRDAYDEISKLKPKIPIIRSSLPINAYDGCVLEYTDTYLVSKLYRFVNKLEDKKHHCQYCNSNIFTFESIENQNCYNCRSVAAS